MLPHDMTFDSDLSVHVEHTENDYGENHVFQWT